MGLASSCPDGLTVSRRLSFALLFLLILGLTLPVLALVASSLPGMAALTSSLGMPAGDILREMAGTVLPGYLQTTLWLTLAVAVGVTVVGTVSAIAITLFEFPGRRVLEWALLLPLAMPAYVVAYAYTDFLQFSGPLQTALREATGLEGRMFPEVRSVGGAAFVFIFSLYPYVYLLARSALSERAARLMEAARVLGAPLRRRIMEIALPLARPAVAAGVALALMETLADFGVSSYFAIQTFTAGIYKAWLVMDNRAAAAQLATMLLALVGLLLWLEHRAQARMRFAAGRSSGADTRDSRPLVLHGYARVLAWLLCTAPVLLGFVIPVVLMLRPLQAESNALPWGQFLTWAANSARLALLTAALAVFAALGLAMAQRRHASRITRAAVQLAGLGYAVPGAVVVVGLLLPLGWLQAVWPLSPVAAWVTATSLGLVWAYLVRFCAVALQSIQSGYARIPVSLDDSARLLGCTGWDLMRRVHAPLLRRSTAVAALLVFVDVMKELPATLVLRPFDSDTLAVVTYQLARDERLGEAALPALALVLVGLIPVALLSRTLRTSESR
ncbi:MAG: Sulfate transport system permease protein CysW [Pseudomonadota bacterium]